MGAIQFLFAFLDYAKIPTAVIQLSIHQETFFEEILKVSNEKESVLTLQKHLEYQKILTKFLRSGKLLNNDSCNQNKEK